MKIGVIGNRAGWTYNEVKKKLETFNIYKTDVIISGGAEGVDTFAQMFAKEIGAKIIIIYPDPQQSIPQRYFDRNYKIICESDCMIAFQKFPHRSGTQNTINAAKKNGKKVIIIGPEGELCPNCGVPMKKEIVHEIPDKNSNKTPEEINYENGNCFKCPDWNAFDDCCVRETPRCPHVDFGGKVCDEPLLSQNREGRNVAGSEPRMSKSESGKSEVKK